VPALLLHLPLKIQQWRVLKKENPEGAFERIVYATPKIVFSIPTVGEPISLLFQTV